MKMFFKNVDYIVNNVKILDNVDFSIAPEKFTSVVGSNGSGKTTLLSLLTSNIYPTSVQIIAPISEKISYASPEVNARYWKLVIRFWVIEINKKTKNIYIGKCMWRAYLNNEK